MRRTRILALSGLLAALLVQVPLADEARVPIFAPTTITQPGHYILTRDISVAGGDVITIKANNVTLDLNGRTIVSGSASGVLVSIEDGFTDVTVLHGWLSGGGIGVFYSSATVGVRLKMERLDFQNTGFPININGADYVQMLSCRISGGGLNYAVFVSGVGSGSYGGRFVDNVIKDVGGQGLHFQGLSGGEVRGNQVEHFGTLLTPAYGIVLTSISLASASYGGNSLENNIVRSSDDDFGIAIYAGPANLMMNNLVTGLGGIGMIIATDGNRIVGNVVSKNSQGISVSSTGSSSPTADRNILERNHIEGNAGDGVVVTTVSPGSNYDLLDSNVIEGNGGFGIRFNPGSTGCAYRNNMLRNNTSGAVVGTATDAGGNIL